ncbi:MAG: TIGR00730 family Rossman fold protein [Verrucomicrobiales bacterium]|nr:TIGR00730 family Rossman fold protein [Verrucomicrobiales bacterium]
MKALQSICIYCGSSSGSHPEYRETALSLGRFLAREGIRVVYGGGNVGLMGAVADGALNAGGEVIGVIPEALKEKELAHIGLTELHAVSSMHERKTMMAELSDAFIALPGGIGTLEEIFEVYTWTQLGFHEKPCAFLNVAGYFDPLLEFLDRMVEHRFLKKEHLDCLLTGSDYRALINRIQKWESATFYKWIDREEQT